VIKNTGTLAIVNPVMSYFLNGVKKQTDTILQTLNHGDSLSHTFSQTADMSVQNNYNVSVLLTVAGDADATNDIAELNINQLVGINELNKNIGLFVIPNPSVGLFNVKINGVEGRANISICDLQGRVVWNETELMNKNSYDQQISLQSQAKGMYFLRVQTEIGMRTEKICVQ